MAVTALVASGRGGAGKSTVTALLGEALAFSGARVLAVELDSGLRSLDGALGVAKDVVFDLGDIIRGSSKASDAVYRCGFCGRLSLIAASARSAELPRGTLGRIAGELGGDFDFMLFDCPAGIGPAISVAGAEADCALIVATPDPASISGARAAADTLKGVGCVQQRLIINRVPPKVRLLSPLASLDEVIDGSGVQLIGALWDDRETRDAVAFGRALSPSSKNAAPFANIARRMRGERVPLSFR